MIKITNAFHDDVRDDEEDDLAIHEHTELVPFHCSASVNIHLVTHHDHDDAADGDGGDNDDDAADDDDEADTVQ